RKIEPKFHSNDRSLGAWRGSLFGSLLCAFVARAFRHTILRGLRAAALAIRINPSRDAVLAPRRRLHRRRTNKPAATGVHASPDAAGPADFDQAIRFIEYEYDLLSWFEGFAKKQAQAAARKIGGEHLALVRLALGLAGRSQHHGFGPA